MHVTRDTRCTDHYDDSYADQLTTPQNLSMDNYLKEIQSNFNNEFNFIYAKNGATNSHSKNRLSGHCIPPDIGHIKMWFNSALLRGLQLYERDGALVYQSAAQWVFTDERFTYVETVLEYGERIVAAKSYNKTNTRRTTTRYSLCLDRESISLQLKY